MHAYCSLRRLIDVVSNMRARQHALLILTRKGEKDSEVVRRATMTEQTTIAKAKVFWGYQMH